MRDPIHIDAARGDVGGDEHTHRARFEILQRTEPLVLRAIGMDGARFDSAAFEPASDLGLRRAWSAKKPEPCRTVGIAQEMKQ